MNLSTEQLELIEKSLLGELSKSEQELLEQIPNWREHVDFQNNLLASLSVFNSEGLKSELMDFEAEFQLQQIQQERKIGILEKLKKQIDLALDEIQFLFQPIPHYQPHLGMVNRNGNLIVLKPELGLDLQEYQLTFELGKTPTHDLQLTIENNIQETLIYQKVSKDRGISFSIPLQDLQNTPGRYYWRLVMNREVVMGEFFIEKSRFDS